MSEKEFENEPNLPFNLLCMKESILKNLVTEKAKYQTHLILLYKTTSL